MAETTDKKGIFKKLIDKGIDKLSKLERKYVQGIDYEDDPLYQKEIEKKEKEEFDELFKAKGGRIKKKKMMSGGIVKKYAKGGGIRKANYK